MAIGNGFLVQVLIVNHILEYLIHHYNLKIDPKCEYIKKWLPNLSNIPNKELHHWESHNHKYNLKDIGYFKPIIDYKESKEKVLKMYKKAFDNHYLS